MKKIALACGLIIAAFFVLTICRKSSRKDNADIKTEAKNKDEGRTKMKRTATGLEYDIITEGKGETPTKGKPVTVHYTGWLNEKGEKGKKFDSSVDRKQPFSFTLGAGQVIKGWDEGVASMRVGEIRRLFIPSNLGYGARGAGGVIPPNADLIFDVELLKV